MRRGEAATPVTPTAVPTNAQSLSMGSVKEALRRREDRGRRPCGISNRFDRGRHSNSSSQTDGRFGVCRPTFGRTRRLTWFPANCWGTPPMFGSRRCCTAAISATVIARRPPIGARVCRNSVNRRGPEPRRATRTTRRGTIESGSLSGTPRNSASETKTGVILTEWSRPEETTSNFWWCRRTPCLSLGSAARARSDVAQHNLGNV